MKNIGLPLRSLMLINSSRSGLLFCYGFLYYFEGAPVKEKILRLWGLWKGPPGSAPPPAITGPPVPEGPALDYPFFEETCV